MSRRRRDRARRACKERYDDRDRARAPERARARQRDAGAAPREDRRQHGRRPRHAAASLLDGAVTDLTIITGQKPLVTRAKKSIAGFKLREGNAIGAKVTLRGDRMWEFYDRLVSLAIPRIRDFRGLRPKSFDGRGNYTFGVTEQLIFPEIDYDKIDTVRGMDITIVTTGTHRRPGPRAARALGFPFRRDERPGVEHMAKKALVQKQQRKPKFKVRGYTRCRRCGRRVGVPQVRALPHLPARRWRTPARSPA